MTTKMLYEKTEKDGVITFTPVSMPEENNEGIDVSLYQGVIDWGLVRTQKSFAFIKATQSNNITDPKFDTNWAGAKAAGIPRGAYHYFKFSVDPDTQADLFCSKLANDRGELQPAVDVEDTLAPASATQLKQFIDTVELRLGIRPIIYTGAWFWNNARWGGPVAWAKDYSLWVASYTSSPIIPTDWKTWKYWQYSSSGKVTGISGNVDLNIVNTEEPRDTLNVPWLGQNTSATTDDYSNSDCGPACVAMWLRYLGKNVTVDDVSRATGKPAGYTYTVFADLDKAANFYGLDLVHQFGTLTLDMIRQNIDLGRPVIALVHYPSLPKIFDTKYIVSHWILITGYAGDTFYYHDPYWLTASDGSHIEISSAQLTTALQNVSKNGNTPMQGATQRA